MAQEKAEEVMLKGSKRLKSQAKWENRKHVLVILLTTSQGIAS